MNIIKTLLATAICIASVAVNAGTGFTSYSATGVAYNASTTNYAVITDESKSGGDPTIDYVNSTCPTAGSLTSSNLFLVATNIFPLAANAGGLALAPAGLGLTNIVTSTNGLYGGLQVVIEHMRTPRTFELAVLGVVNPVPWFYVTNADTTIITNWGVQTAVATLSSNLPSDNMYPLGVVSYIPFTTNLNLIGPGIVTGRAKKPMVVECAGTGATVNAVHATFAQ